MKKLFVTALAISVVIKGFTQLTVFERSNGLRSATYAQCMNFYQTVDKTSPIVSIKKMGNTDAGINLHLVLISGDRDFNPLSWKKKNKTVFLINNGIHPGEPDGIDASMLLTRDIASGKLKLPANVAIAIIPVYNIGGALNRNSSGRVNQNGPEEYGFRGNSQNLDLNRDFTKTDAKESLSFAQIFHYLTPQLFLDTHVSDGADYQHIITLLTTQYNKLGNAAGELLRTKLEPAIYSNMKQAGYDLIPYVDFEFQDPDKGFTMFYDAPRYSTGYTSLFNTIGFMSETHMVKPYKSRVESTLELMKTIITLAGTMGPDINEAIALSSQQLKPSSKHFLRFEADTARHGVITFKGFKTDSVFNAATGSNQLVFNHNRPYTKNIEFYSFFTGRDTVTIPAFYIVPQAFDDVITRMKANNIRLKKLEKDSVIFLTKTKITSYQTSNRPYEKHYRHYNTQTTEQTDSILFRRGDYLIATNQPGVKYIVEMLEPRGNDSFFAWNFFDGFLQQKEGFSTWRWHQMADKLIEDDPLLKQELEAKKKNDLKFAACSECILDFIYKRSPYFERSYMLYPIYKKY